MDKLLEIKLHPADVRLICSALMAYDARLDAVKVAVSFDSDCIGMDDDTVDALEAFYDNRRSGCRSLAKKLDMLLR